MTFQKAAAATALLVGSGMVGAQEHPTAAASVAQIEEAPAARSTIGGAASHFAIEAGTDKTTASGKIGYAWSVGGDNAWKLALSAKAPFDPEKEKQKDLGTLSGLTAGTSAQLEIGVFNWPKVNFKGMDEVCRDAIEEMFNGTYSWLVTGEPYSNRYKYFNWGGKDKVLGGARCEAILSSREGLENAIKARNEATRADPPAASETAPADAITPENWDEIQKKHLVLYRAAKHQTPDQRPRRGAQGVTLAITANRQTFAYADVAAPAMAAEETKNGFGVSVAYTFVGDRFVAGGGFAWERSYEGEEEQQVCSPIGTTGSTSCRDTALAAPTDKEDRLVFAEVRAALPIFGLAISPRVEFSLEESEYAVKLPIFVARDSKKVLNGGIALGWDEENDFGATVFVGKSFDFFD